MEEPGKEFMQMVTKAIMREVFRKLLRVAHTKETIRMMQNQKTLAILFEWAFPE